MRPRLFVAMVAVCTFWGCTTLLGLDDLEYRDQDAGALPDADTQPPPGSVLWSRKLGGLADDRAEGVAVDPSGEVVVSGCTTNPDGGAPDCTMQADVFVSRYSAEGELRWDSTFGAEGNQFAADLAGGPSGAVVVGHFEGNYDFGGPPLVNAGNFDIFVAKLGPAGDHLWSARFGTADEEQAFRVATDSDENVLVTGTFRGSVDFGEGPLSGGLGLNPYVAKFSKSGGVIWSQTFQGPDRAYAPGLATDADGNVLLAGLFVQSMDFGGDGGVIDGMVGVQDAFAAVFEPDGALRWARPLIGGGTKTGVGVGADGAGNVVVVGQFDGTMEIGATPIPTKGSYDIFVVKLARLSGEIVWATYFGGPGEDHPFDMLVDEEGNIMITGEFRETADFQGTPLTSKGGKDAFLVMLEPSGSVRWAQRFGDIGDDYGTRLGFGPSGEIFMAGAFSGTIQFGDDFLPSFGGTDGFLVKFAPP